MNSEIISSPKQITTVEAISDSSLIENNTNRFQRIFFVVTNVSASYGKALNPHLGIAMLMASLDRHGFQTTVIDEQLGYSVDEIIAKIKEFKADLVGVTMFCFDFAKTYQTINRIKDETGLPIALGGAHISSVKKEALERTKADFGVVRDGEIPIVE